MDPDKEANALYMRMYLCAVQHSSALCAPWASLVGSGSLLHLQQVSLELRGLLAGSDDLSQHPELTFLANFDLKSDALLVDDQGRLAGIID